MSVRLISESFFVQTQIDHILAWFDFDRVEKTMETLEWVWVPIGRIPSKTDLKDHAIDLLNTAVKEKYASCGGLVAERMDLENGEFYLELRFEISKWDSFALTEDSKVRPKST